MNYNLEITIADERGRTEVKLSNVPAERLQADPMLAPLLKMHELSLQDGKKRKLSFEEISNAVEQYTKGTEAT
jgi:hypothetical protein